MFVRIARCASRLLLIGLSLAVAACATRKIETPFYPWPDNETTLPPIVVRTASVASATREGSAAAKAMGTAGHELLLSGLYFFMFPVGPIVTLVGIPLSLMDAQTEYLKEMGCPQRVQDRLVDVPAWVQSTFAGTPVAELVARGARSQLRAGGPQIVVLQGAGSAEERSVQYERLGKDLGTKTLILVDVSVLFRDAPGANDCDVKLSAQGQVRVQPIGRPEMNDPSYSVWAEQPPVPLEQWASEPARARAQLDELLATLGKNLVGSYGDRMGCWQRRCEWDATERTLPSRTAPLWCLVDPNADAVRCDFIDYESCATAKPDERYRCVTTGPY